MNRSAEAILHRIRLGERTNEREGERESKSITVHGRLLRRLTLPRSVAS